MKARAKRSKKTKKTKRAGRAAARGTRFRSVLAKVSLTIDVPPHVTDRQALAKVKRLRSHWTDATYCTGPNGTVVDTPAGIDIP